MPNDAVDGERPRPLHRPDGRPVRICYLLSHYVSHYQAGMALRACLGGLGFDLVDQPGDADLVIIHNEPWSYPGYYRAFPELREKYVIGYAVWETDRLPEHYRFALGLPDEVWTCSSYCRDALRHASDRVTVIPHVVRPPARDTAAIDRLRQRIGYDESLFYFYTITNAANARKNVAELVQAFANLSAAGQARLVIKSHRELPPDLAATPGVIELAGRLEDAEIDALHHIGQCFVSAHRSEGWGLGLSDAMACGNIVVATGFSGNMDFMTERNALPVAYRLEPVRPEEVRQQPGVLTTDMKWAYADTDDLQRQMGRCLAEWETLQPLARQAEADMAHYGEREVAALIERRLAAILSTDLRNQPARRRGI